MSTPTGFTPTDEVRIGCRAEMALDAQHGEVIEVPTGLLDITIDGHTVGQILPATARRYAVSLLQAADEADGASDSIEWLRLLVEEQGGILLTPNQIAAWTGEPNDPDETPDDPEDQYVPLTPAQRARLADAIPNSSIPEAIETIADSIRNS